MEIELRKIQAAHGVFLRKEAVRLGYDDKQIARRVRAGDWIRAKRGAYVFADTWTDLDPGQQYGVRGRAAYRRAKAEVVLSHTSALQEAGDNYWDLGLDEVHLTRRDRKAGRREAGICQHRGRLMEGDVVLSPGGVWITSPTRTVLDVTTITDVERALVVANVQLHAGQTTREELHRRQRLMKQTPHSLTTELVLRLVDPRIESVLETRCYFCLWRAGVKCPEPQVDVFDETGNLVGTVDFAWPELGVFIECDGNAKYLKLRREGESIEDVILREKKRQDRISEITGWICVRVTWADLFEPARLVGRIEKAFARAAA